MKKWVISCNLKGNDIMQQFLEDGSICYETRENIAKEDEVYIFANKPLNSVFLRCNIKEVIEKKAGEDFIEKKEVKVIKLVPIQNYLSNIDELSYEELVKHGLSKSNLDGEVSEKLSRYFDSLNEEGYFIY